MKLITYHVVKISNISFARTEANISFIEHLNTKLHLASLYNNFKMHTVATCLNICLAAIRCYFISFFIFALNM